MSHATYRPVDGFPALPDGALLPRLLRVHPGGNSGRCACPKPRGVRRAPPGRLPRSLIHRSAGSAPSCAPGTSPRATATRHAASPARTKTVGQDGPKQQTGPSVPTAHSRQFRGFWDTGIGFPTPFCLATAPGPLAADRCSIVRGRSPPNTAHPASVLPLGFTPTVTAAGGEVSHPARSYGASWRSGVFEQSQQPVSRRGRGCRSAAIAEADAFWR